MRASAVKTAIADSIESITVDSNVGGESFAYVDLGGREPGALSERAFEVELTGVAPTILITESAQIVSFLVTIYYASYPQVEDRIADDAERVVKKMYRLFEQNADIFKTDFDEVSVAPSGIMEGMLEAALPIAVTYRRTGV
tara:strand:+ start:1489 stop:1911 length:423 start_codon:yes stop_codon:yes gene_type:complete